MTQFNNFKGQVVQKIKLEIELFRYSDFLIDKCPNPETFNMNNPAALENNFI